MKLGMVGLPNVGKSTLFNALTNAGAESANYPFCTIEPNVGIVSVPDERLEKLKEMYNPNKFTPATLEFVDIAGLVKGDKKYIAEVEFLESLKAHLEAGHSARSYNFTEEEAELIKSTPLLSAKPVIYAANLSEEDFKNNIETSVHYQKVCEIAKTENASVFPICAQLEAEISDMGEEDKEMFLSELGLEVSGLDRIIKEGYALLGLISFLTAGKDEVRAWTITKGTKAPQAAGKIHTDFEKGFIRAEVVSFDDLMACGTMAGAKEKGLVRLEGKEYVVQDGDIILFRFNV